MTIPNVGDRVRLINDVDNYPVGIFEAGLTGTLKTVDENGYWVRLDKHFDVLDEWGNELQIWTDETHDAHASTYIEVIE